MRLPLDWDSEALKEMHLPAVLDRQPAQDTQQTLAQYVEDTLGTDATDHTGKWELWQSSNFANSEEGEGGYHYIEYGLDADLESLRRLRTAYGDDKLRIALDGKRMQWGSPFVNVMYHMKNIKPHEHKPYETGNRARLLERHGFDGGEYVESKNNDGTLNYPALIEALADHPDFGSRAALFRRLQQRGSVTVSTDASKRAYDLVNGRRSPTRNEAKALRDYAESREIGHYGEQAEVPEELAAKPTRTTFHEYFEMPEIEFDSYDFGSEDSDSEWFPANIRTGTYGDVDEMSVKQVHDNLVPEILDMLSPGTYQTNSEGEREYYGVDISRYDYAISLERDRPLDRDEKARYKRLFYENQPQRTEEHTFKDATEDGDPFDGDAVLWEVIVYDGEDALEATGSTNYWWIARGVVHVDQDGVHTPLQDSTIIEDTEGWI